MSLLPRLSQSEIRLRSANWIDGAFAGGRIWWFSPLGNDLIQARSAWRLP